MIQHIKRLSPELQCHGFLPFRTAASEIPVPAALLSLFQYAELVNSLGPRCAQTFLAQAQSQFVQSFAQIITGQLLATCQAKKHGVSDLSIHAAARPVAFGGGGYHTTKTRQPEAERNRRQRYRTCDLPCLSAIKCGTGV